MFTFFKLSKPGFKPSIVYFLSQQQHLRPLRSTNRNYDITNEEFYFDNDDLCLPDKKLVY